MANRFLVQARKFCNMFQFINDLIATNDDGEFEYTPELKVKQANSSDKEGYFFDLDIKSVSKTFSLSLYREASFQIPL